MLVAKKRGGTSRWKGVVCKLSSFQFIFENIDSFYFPHSSTTTLCFSLRVHSWLRHTWSQRTTQMTHDHLTHSTEFVNGTRRSRSKRKRRAATATRLSLAETSHFLRRRSRPTLASKRPSSLCGLYCPQYTTDVCSLCVRDLIHRNTQLRSSLAGR